MKLGLCLFVLTTVSLDLAVAEIGVGAKPVPGGAVILDGSRRMLDKNWTYWEGPRFASSLPIKWKSVNDPVKQGGKSIMTFDPAAAGGKYGTADIVTKKKYRDFRLHVEFLVMKKGGNSGVYLQNRYEIQVLDGDKTKHGMGAVINETPSPYHAYNGVGKWNAYDIVFRAARFKEGRRVEKAMVTMYFNGKKVHKNQQITKVWGGANSGLDGGNDNGNGITDTPGGLKLQCEGHDVRYRNVWIRELDIKKANTDFREPIVKASGKDDAKETPDAVKEKPNFVIIFIDDMGYGDIEPFGSTLNKTPNLTRMATEGMKLTSFYAAPVCSASRAQLLTGCYAPRVSVPGVFFPAGPKGLHPDELTIADYLSELGYATTCVGKWHLGDQPEFLPTKQGFDHYFGIPYSNDMQRVSAEDGRRVTPLLRDDKVAELLEDEGQRRVTREYTDEAVKFIKTRKDKPFFLYLPHTAMHIPLFPHEDFVGKSTHGTYGDWVAEVDWSVGQVLDALRETKQDENTLVIFTSDNGPWASQGKAGGVSGPLRGSKGCTLEGGVREPTIAWWPGKIAAGSLTDEMGGTTDLLPTLVSLAGGKLKADRKIDGLDLSSLLLGKAKESPRKQWFYYQGTTLQAVRSGDWKLALTAQSLGMGIKQKPDDLQVGQRLYNLASDLGETKNLFDDNPQVVAELTGLANQMRSDIGSGKAGPGVRPPGTNENPVTLYPTKQKVRRARKIGWQKLKVGDSFPAASAPKVANKTFTIKCSANARKTDGVLVAHGGTQAGYVLYAKSGRLTFSVRVSGSRLRSVRADLPEGNTAINARLMENGRMQILLNDKVAASLDQKGLLIGKHPQEDFCIGHDNGNPVDAAAPKAAFKGAIGDIRVRLNQ